MRALAVIDPAVDQGSTLVTVTTGCVPVAYFRGWCRLRNAGESAPGRGNDSGRQHHKPAMSPQDARPPRGHRAGHFVELRVHGDQAGTVLACAFWQSAVNSSDVFASPQYSTILPSARR